MQAAKSAPDAQQTKPEVSVRLAHGPECCVKHANDNKGQGIRANSGKSEGGNLELTICTHTRREELVPV